MRAITDVQFAERTETISGKRTNRSAFFRGEINKYRCVDVDSSFLPSFYIVFKPIGQRQNIIEKLKSDNILSVFYYISLHGSPFCKNSYLGTDLSQSDRYSDCLLRLPMFYELNVKEIIDAL